MTWHGPALKKNRPEERKYTLWLKNSTENAFLREKGITCLADHEIGGCLGGKKGDRGTGGKNEMIVAGMTGVAWKARHYGEPRRVTLGLLGWLSSKGGFSWLANILIFKIHRIISSE